MNSQTMKSETDQFYAGLLDQMDEMLSRCTEPQRNLFRLMYNHDGKHTRDVDGVKQAQLDNAFSQIERTLAKNAKAEG